MLKKFLRDKNSTILLIVGIVISFFVVVNVLAVQNEARKQVKVTRYSKYYKEAVFVTDEDVYDYGKDWSKIVNDIRNIPTNENTCIEIETYCSIVGNGFDNPCIYAVLSDNNIDLKLISGRNFTDEEMKSGEKVVLVSSLYEDRCYEKENQKYIKIDDEEYKVIGVYLSADLLYEQYRMDLRIPYNSLSDKAKNSAGSMNFLKIRCSSNGKSDSFCNKALNKINEIFNKYGYSIYNSELIGKNELLGSEAKLNNILMFVTLAFTIINCMIISGVWISRRYKELIIRRTYGWNMKDIILLLVKDLFLYCLVAVCLSIILQYVYSIVTDGDSLRINYLFGNLVYILTAVMGIIVFIMLVPIAKIRSVMPAASIRKKY